MDCVLRSWNTKTRGTGGDFQVLQENNPEEIEENKIIGLGKSIATRVTRPDA